MPLSNPRIVINLDELVLLQRIQLANLLSRAVDNLGVTGSECDRAFRGVKDFIKDNHGEGFIRANIRCSKTQEPN